MFKSIFYKGIFRGSQPTVMDLQQLKNYGVRHVLCLETDLLEDGDFFTEGDDVQSLEMKFWVLPLGRFFPPSPAEVQRAMYVFMHANVFVHCKQGVDRTGFIVAKYRILKQGWSKEQAVTEFRNCGRHWWYFWWEWFL